MYFMIYLLQILCNVPYVPHGVLFARHSPYSDEQEHFGSLSLRLLPIHLHPHWGKYCLGVSL